MEEKRELIPTRQTLLVRLRDVDNHESWKDFFDTYWKLIYGTAVRAGLTDSEAQEVVQETVIAVARNIPDFRYNPAIGSFKGWLLKLTRWRIMDQLRRRHREMELGRWKSETSNPNEIEAVAEPEKTSLESFWNEEWETNVVGAAIERVKNSVDPKQYQVFDLYVLKEWPVSKVAQTLNISAARIYLAKHRVSRLIKKEIKALEEKYR
jgi:RNA polymerase sigma factor (sigma-70 family)